MLPSNGQREASSAKTMATSSCPASTTKKPHHIAGPADRNANAKIPYRATIGEMNANASAKIANSENSRLRPSLSPPVVGASASSGASPPRVCVTALSLFPSNLPGAATPTAPRPFSATRRTAEQDDDRTKAAAAFDASSECP